VEASLGDVADEDRMKVRVWSFISIGRSKRLNCGCSSSCRHIFLNECEYSLSGKRDLSSEIRNGPSK